jgi:phosphoribosylaminoimidazole-succinocarboxamide synthase
MITDELQTVDGKRFWEVRISQAFQNNHFVYFLDKNSVDKKLQRIESSDDFFEYFEPLGWGSDKAHQNKWFVISLEELN